MGAVGCLISLPFGYSSQRINNINRHEKLSKLGAQGGELLTASPGHKKDGHGNQPEKC